jgi:hypothetical protein
VISGCLCDCSSPRTSHAWQNMAAPKKHFEFYTSSFAKVRALIAGQNGFSERKNLSNTSEIQWSPKRRNTRKIDALVTTRHLFWPNHRRKPASLLPSWLQNSHFPPAERRQGGRGGPQPEPLDKASTEKRARNFPRNVSPTLF